MSNNLKILIAFGVLTALVVFGTIGFVASSGNQKTTEGTSVVTGDTQVLQIKAVNGGYEPRRVVAKAGIPGKIIFPKTTTFGCQNAVVIPELQANATLSRLTDTEFSFAAQPAGKIMKGSCSMGMYDFEIVFE